MTRWLTDARRLAPRADGQTINTRANDACPAAEQMRTLLTYIIIFVQVPPPQTRTFLQHDRRNDLGFWCNALPEHQMALIASGLRVRVPSAQILSMVCGFYELGKNISYIQVRRPTRTYRMYCIVYCIYCIA